MTLEGRTVSHYQILEQLGSGGMGIVYRAIDNRLDRAVALKFLPPELSRDEEANARFMQEAKAASALDHPNICTIYEVGESDDGRLFIAMALYEGQTLKYRLQNEDAPLSATDALFTARQIADGLSRAHKKGIVHRDIKPANIMVQDDGLVKILDFGLAKLPGVLSLTKTGSTLGTAAYMSPEQIRGEDVDERTDLWSLGVVLYEMLTGGRAFAGDYEQATTYAILNKEVEFPEMVGHDVNEVVSRLLDKDPAARFESAEQASSELQSLLGSGTGVAQPSQSESGGQNLISKPMAIGSGVILLIAAAVSLFTQLNTSSSDDVAIDRHVIAVVPFTVRGSPELDYLGEGIVDLLSVKLDGAAELRSVDPNAIFGTIAKDALIITTPVDAVELAKRLGAGRVIMGNVTQAGDQLQVSASLYGADSEVESEARVETSGDAEISLALDDLARQIVESLLHDPDWESFSIGSVTTESFPALKSYLRGNQEMRQSGWSDAVESFSEAVKIDSSFALAWLGLAGAYGWLADTLEFPALVQARRYSGSLPWRTKTLVEAADNGFNLGDGPKSRDLYLSILADYPHDTQALRGIGEVLFHYNPMLGRPQNEANEFFLRAAELAPENVDYTLHVYDSALENWDFALTDSLGRWQAEHSGRQDFLEYTQHMEAITSRSPQDDSWTITDPGVMNTHFVFDLWAKVATHVEDLEAADQIAAMVMEPGRYPEEDRDRMTFRTANAAIGQGRLKEFAALSESSGSIWRGQSIIMQSLMLGLPVYPVRDEVLQKAIGEVEDWDPSKYPARTLRVPDVHAGEYESVKAYLTALLSFRMDDLSTFEDHRRTLGALADDKTGKDLAFSALRSLEALQALQENRFEAAIEAVDAARLNIFWRLASGSPLYEQIIDRFIKAEALRHLGRYHEAITIYRSITAGDHVNGLPLIGPSYLGVADAYDRLGETEKAIEFYTRFVRMWKNCDLELVLIRDKAEGELERLLAKSVMEPEQ